MTATRASQILHNRQASGVIVGPMPHSVDELDLFWDKFCSVRIGYSLRNCELTTITADQFGNARMLFERLRSQGFKRIGFCCPQTLDKRTNNQWLGGYLAAQQTISDAEKLPPHIEPNLEPDSEKFLAWVEENSPDALITGGGRRFYELLEEAGFSIPDQLNVVSLNADGLEGEIAGVNQNGQHVGIVSVDLLVGVIHRFKVGLESHPKVVTVPGVWQNGNSFAEPAKND